MEVASRPVEISIDDQLYDLSIKIIPTLLPAGEKRLELRPTREKSKVFRKIGNFIGKSETGRSINFSLILFLRKLLLRFERGIIEVKIERFHNFRNEDRGSRVNGVRWVARREEWGEGIDNKQRIVDGSTNVEGCDGWCFISVNVAEVL